MAPNYSVYRQMCHHGPTCGRNCCSLGAARWRQTTAYTIKCVIVRPLGVKNAALLERLDGAKLLRIPGNSKPHRLTVGAEVCHKSEFTVAIYMQSQRPHSCNTIKSQDP